MGLTQVLSRPLQLPLWRDAVPGRVYTLPPTAVAQDPDDEAVRLCAEHRAECLEDPYNPVHDLWCPDGPHPVKVFLAKERHGQERIYARVNVAVTPIEVPSAPRRKPRPN